MGEEDRVEDKGQVFVDRLVSTARLGTPIRNAGYRISACRWTKRGTSAYRTRATIKPGK